MQKNTLTVHFLGSFAKVTGCPVLPLPEYCFIGRSNVGKSSMINYLTGNNEIARTSKKPGKTQTINLFRIEENPEWAIADLPGYGYAAVSRSTRGEWSSLIDDYMLKREHLICTFLLIDIRHPQQAKDKKFMEFLGKHQIPFCLLYTKSDKLKPNVLTEAVQNYEQAILEDWETLPPSFVTSSHAQVGRDEILAYIRDMNNTFVKQAR
jgi:GTP-binding protein